MRKTLISLAAIGCFALASTAAHANDGSITFTGTLVDMTCQVIVNNGSDNGTVLLPTVSVAGLSGLGDTSGDTNFDIRLAGCVGDKTKVVTEFLPGGSVTEQGRLKNELDLLTGDGAGNVELQVLDGVTREPIQLGDSTQLTATKANIDAITGNATLPYVVRYYATTDSGVLPGKIESTVQFSLVYE